MIIKLKLALHLILFLLLLATYSPAEDDEDNPHENMIDDQFACLDCHTEVPKAGEKSPVYFLVDKPSENCLGCHDETQHPGSKEHLGKKATPMPGDENGQISCFSCHDPHPQGVIEGRTVYNIDLSDFNKEFIKLVVMPPLSAETGHKLIMNEEKEVYLRDPAEKLCVNCHQQDKQNNWRNYTLWNRFTDLFSY